MMRGIGKETTVTEGAAIGLSIISVVLLALALLGILKLPLIGLVLLVIGVQSIAPLILWKTGVIVLIKKPRKLLILPAVTEEVIALRTHIVIKGVSPCFRCTL